MKVYSRVTLCVVMLSGAFWSCDDNVSEEVSNEMFVINQFNKKVSAASKALDTLSVDLDNDGKKDIRVGAGNNQYSIVFQPAIVKGINIERLNTGLEFAFTLEYANYANGFRMYNFGSSSLFIFYAKSFSPGSTIDSLVSFAGPQFCWTSSHIINNSLHFPYNETLGDFRDATGFVAFRMKKQDGYHYGWVKLSNANQCMEATIVSSAYCLQRRKGVVIKQ